MTWMTGKTTLSPGSSAVDRPYSTVPPKKLWRPSERRVCCDAARFARWNSVPSAGGLQQQVERGVGFAQGQQALGHIVERHSRGLEAVGQRRKDRRQFVL